MSVTVGAAETDLSPPEWQLLESLRRHRIGSETTLCVAYSGGSDSTALLAAAKAIAHTFGGLVALYLDHGIRESNERRAEKTVVRELCSSLGIRLELGQIPAGSLIQESLSHGLEAAARQARYAFFRERSSIYRNPIVITAHHLDDQLETIVLRFLRGGGPGQGGIEELREIDGIKVLRPWLSLDKQTIQTYLAMKNLPYIKDSSNGDLGFERNRVRHEIIPVIERLFPDYRRTIVAGAWRDRCVAEFLRSEAERQIRWDPLPELDPMRRLGYRYSSDREAFFSAPELIQLESLRALVVADGRFDSLPRDAFRKEFRKGDPKVLVGGLLQWGPYRLDLFHDRILWGADIVLNRKNGYVLMVRENVHVVLGPNDRPLVSTHSMNTAAPACEIQLDAAAIAAPLLLRSRRSGDRIKVPGAAKSVKKLLSEWKIPKDLRDRVPILEDRHGVCAVVGELFGFRNLIAERCRLRQQCERGAPEIQSDVSGVFRLWVSVDGVNNEYEKR